MENSADAYAVIEKLTERQRDVLGAIAINQDGGHNRKTIASLMERGLIEPHDEAMHFRDGLPPMMVKRYTVPLFVHIAWCKWCSEQPVTFGDGE